MVKTALNIYMVVVYVVLVCVTSLYVHEYTHLQQELERGNDILEVCYFGARSTGNFKPTLENQDLNTLLFSGDARGWVGFKPANIPGIPGKTQYIYGITLDEFEAYRNQIIYVVVLMMPVFLSIYLDDQ